MLNYSLKTYKMMGYASSSISTTVQYLITPTINKYFFTAIDQQWLAASMLITSLMMALMQTVFSSEKVRSVALRYIRIIMIVTISGYIFVSLYTIDAVNIRYILFSVFAVLNNVVVGTLFMEQLNDKLHGKELTTYKSVKSSCSLWGSVAGSILGMVLTFDIYTAIYIQSASSLIEGVLDDRMISTLRKLENDKLKN